MSSPVSGGARGLPCWGPERDGRNPGSSPCCRQDPSLWLEPGSSSRLGCQPRPCCFHESQTPWDPSQVAPSSSSSKNTIPLTPKYITTFPVRSCEQNGKNTAFAPCSSFSCFEMNSRRWRLPSSSSPSTTNNRLTGIFWRVALIDSQAFKNPRSSPFVLNAPLATRHRPNGGTSVKVPASGSTRQPGSSTGMVSYIM